MAQLFNDYLQLTSSIIPISKFKKIFNKNKYILYNYFTKQLTECLIMKIIKCIYFLSF